MKVLGFHFFTIFPNRLIILIADFIEMTIVLFGKKLLEDLESLFGS